MPVKPVDHVGGKEGRLHVPVELLNILATVAAALGVVAAGAAISAALPAPTSPWMFAASYAAPGAIAFAIYWWIAQRL